MTAAEISETLTGHPATRELSSPLLQKLIAISRQAVYKPKDVIVSHDEDVRGIHVLRTGTVLLDLPGRSDRVTHKLNAGQSFGEVPTLRELPQYGYDAVATEYGTEIVEIAGAPFRELFATEPELPVIMASSLSDKILHLADRIEELSITCATTRLARHLISRPKRVVGDAHEVDLGVDRKDLAAILAITPEHLSRLFRRWADAGILRPMGRTIAVLRPEVLGAMADVDLPEEPAA